MIKELQVLGLTKNESEVYAALVNNGQSKAGQIIAKLDVHRNIIYEALESLIRKGFVTKISKRGIWWFQITAPDSILTMQKRREQIALGLIEEIKLTRQQTEQQIVVYEGLDSYRSYWLSSLERFPVGTVDYVLGGLDIHNWYRLMGDRAVKKYFELRNKKKIHWKVVHFEITETDRQLIRDTPDLLEYRLWKKNLHQIGNFNVVHDTVVLNSMTESPRVIEIRDPDMLVIFKNIFDAIWEEAIPVTV